jgi:hypothetical protein
MFSMPRVPNKKEPQNEALFCSVFATDLSLPVGPADLLTRTLCQDFHSVNRVFFMKLRFFAAGRWGTKSRASRDAWRGQSTGRTMTPTPKRRIQNTQASASLQIILAQKH